MEKDKCYICGGREGETVNDVHGERVVRLTAQNIGTPPTEEMVCEHCVRFLSYAGNTVSLDTPAELGSITGLPEIKDEL